MGSFKFYYFVILFILYFNYVLCSVPVLIWESSAITKKDDVIPALSQLDVDEFSNHLVKKIHIHKPLIVVFLEETLSIEDFSWQDTKHQGAYPQLKNITNMSSKVEFITSVEDPMSSLKQLTKTHNYIMKKYDENKLPSESGLILIIKMKVPLNNEDRPDLLRRHDGNIAEIYSQLLAMHSTIVAIYTGKQSSWVELERSRMKRDVSENNSSLICYYDNLFNELCTSSPPILNDGTQNITLSGTPEVLQDNRTTYVRMILKYHLSMDKAIKVILRLRFNEDKGRWSLGDIEYLGEDNKAVTLEPSKEISAKVGASYKSDTPVVFSNGLVSLKFTDVQVQAFKKTKGFAMPLAAETLPVFFTGPIWSGLIVTFVLGIILTWGITMLLDIRTMDRFDDPKGKTISVSVQE